MQNSVKVTCLKNNKQNIHFIHCGSVWKNIMAISTFMSYHSSCKHVAISYMNLCYNYSSSIKYIASL